jgi:hypothetical protein
MLFIVGLSLYARDALPWLLALALTLALTLAGVLF